MVKNRNFENRKTNVSVKNLYQEKSFFRNQIHVIHFRQKNLDLRATYKCQNDNEIDL